jgi:hypothetical protein
LIVTKRPFPLKYKYKRYKLDRKNLTHFESIKPHKTVLTDSLAFYLIFTAASSKTIFSSIDMASGLVFVSPDKATYSSSPASNDFTLDYLTLQKRVVWPCSWQEKHLRVALVQDNPCRHDLNGNKSGIQEEHSCIKREQSCPRLSCKASLTKAEEEPPHHPHPSYPQRYPVTPTSCLQSTLCLYTSSIGTPYHKSPKSQASPSRKYPHWE